MADSARNKNIADYWRQELSSADRRWKDFFQQAERIERIYEAGEKTQNAFNILYSNTETLLPSLYNVTPRPVVERRYKDDNLLARIAGKVLERGLEYHCDTPDPEYDSFDANMETSVLGALVPGFGLCRIKYDAKFETVQGPESVEGKEKSASIAKKGNEDDTGDPMDPVEDLDVPPEAERVVYETACGEVVDYRKVLFGPGKRWSRIPWVGFYHAMTRMDVRRRFGPAMAEKLTYTDNENRPIVNKEDDDRKSNSSKGICGVWEIWHRTTKKVFFICPTYPDGPLADPVDDPLKLQGFYPCPEPLVLFSRVNNFIPRQLYLFYENQAKELNRISNRINGIVAALKVRGFYAASLPGMQDLLQKPENTLTPLQNAGVQVDNFDLNKYIWLMPIEKLITVLQQLYVQREQIKRVIYEVTGISDILRGSTVASETATAQSLKNQWGTLRLKKMQKRVQRYVRDYLRLVAEVMAKHYGPQTWAQMTGVQLPTAQEKQAAQQAMQMQQRAMQQPPVGQGPAASPGQPPQPPAQPPLDPKIATAAMMPSWDEVLAFLRQDLQRDYNIDIETNSTIEPDAVEDQEQIAKLLGAVSNMFSSIGPAVEKGALPMAGFKAMLLAVCRRFRFGDEVEEILQQIPDQMPPAGQDKGKEAETQAKLQLTQAETEGKLKIMDKELQVKEAELDLAFEELQLKREELQLKQQELSTKRQASQIKSEGVIAAAHAKTQAAKIAAAAPPVQPKAPMGANPGQVPPGAGAPVNAPV